MSAKLPIDVLNGIFEEPTSEFNRDHETMKQLFDLLGGLVFEKANDNELDGANFLVEVGKTKMEKFKTGRIADNKRVEKPVFGMTIKISDNFQRGDMPAFNAAIVNAHNSWLKQQGFMIENNPNYFFDENKHLARF